MDVFTALYIFLLALVTGYVFSSKVPVILQSSILSASNFIRGIILVGAMIVMGKAETTLEISIGFIAVALAAANAVGGYFLTAKTLNQFNKNNIRRDQENNDA